MPGTDKPPKIPRESQRGRLATAMARIFAGQGTPEDGRRLLSHLTDIVAAPVFVTPTGGIATSDAAAFNDGRRNVAFDLIGSGHFDVRNIKED